MTRQVAIKLLVQIGLDHTLKLPAEVPVGPAEVIVLVDERPNRGRAKSVLGLFADEPWVVDEAMGHVRARRANRHVGPGT